MWPWSHAVIGYLVYTVVVVAVRRRPLRNEEALVVVVATQLPDIVDKPLAWTFAILPNGRSLGHSLLVWLLLAIAVVLVARRLERRWMAPAVLVGSLVGILTDVPPAVLDGDFSEATFLLWPVLPSPDSDVEPSILASVDRLQPADLEQLVLFSLVLIGGHYVFSKLSTSENVSE